MALTKYFQRTALTAALVAGAVTLAPASLTSTPIASAAPSSVRSYPATLLVGDDPLVPLALTALAQADIYGRTHSSATLLRMATARDAVATAIAVRLGLDPVAMRQAWQNADLAHQRVVLSAVSQMGVPYRRNALRPGVAFDCSGLTSWAWQQSGVALPRASYRQIRAFERLTLADAQAGDLVYYPGHVMLYLGTGNAIIHSPQPGDHVKVGTLSKGRARWVRVADPLA
jgi:cell wall-associated NlpC family hydrolase